MPETQLTNRASELLDTLCRVYRERIANGAPYCRSDHPLIQTVAALMAQYAAPAHHSHQHHSGALSCWRTQHSRM